jgi:trk system potassium uptake protein TrkH
MSDMRIGKAISPAQWLVGGFAVLTIIGAVLLMLPYATTNQQGLAFLDALFMSASAVCVTGLAVVTPQTDLSRFGQTVLLVLVQIGGIGFMTIASMMAVLLGRRITIRDRLLLKEALNQHSIDGIVRLVIAIVIATLAIEIVGGLILAVEFMPYMDGGSALYFGIFHAVSAFNNAGFDLFGNSMVGFQSNGVVQLTIALLFMVGGLGYIVMLNMIETRGKFVSMSLHTKLVLVTSGVLLVSATIIIWILEHQRFAAQGMSFATQWLNSFFQGATVRTAGFNSVDLTVLGNGTVYLMMFLMFVGASPGSTGGGIKTTTTAVAVLLVYHLIRGRSEIMVFKRTITNDFVIKSFVLIML